MEKLLLSLSFFVSDTQRWVYFQIISAEGCQSKVRMVAPLHLLLPTDCAYIANRHVKKDSLTLHPLHRI